MSNQSSWKDVLKRFQPFSLGVLDSYNTFKRTEKKYIFPEHQLNGVLRSLKDEYACLEINSNRLFNYTSEYLDTADYQMYLAHHNGKRIRYKIRFRQYAETEEEFVEIKKRTNVNRLLKHRKKLNGNQTQRNKITDVFIISNSNYNPYELETKLTVSYRRITLMHRLFPFKLTFDAHITMSDDLARVHLPGLVIAEFKNYGNLPFHYTNNPVSWPGQQQFGISKYCMGLVLLKPELKYNAFKALVRKIEKTTKRNHYVTA